MGLTITSENNFKLISQDSGDGEKEFPYQIRLSKRNANSNINQTVEVNSYDKILVRNISDNVSRYFYIYTYSNSSTYNLNAGKFSDNIYLNFVTGDDINSSYGEKTITIFN